MSDDFLNNMTEEERDEYHAKIFGVSLKKWKRDKENARRKEEKRLKEGRSLET